MWVAPGQGRDEAAKYFHGARLLLVDDDLPVADALAGALRELGAQVSLVGADGRGVDLVGSLDPEVVLVEESVESVDPLRARLMSSPRLRWARVLAFRADEVFPHGEPTHTDRPPDGLFGHRLAALGERIAPALAPERSLVRAASELARFEVDLGEVGPVRALRALRAAGSDEVLALQVQTSKRRCVVEVAGDQLVGCSAFEAGGERAEGLAALARFLDLDEGDATVERRLASSASNLVVPILEAVDRAADILASAETNRFQALGADALSTVHRDLSRLAQRSADPDGPSDDVTKQVDLAEITGRHPSIFDDESEDRTLPSVPPPKLLADAQRPEPKDETTRRERLGAGSPVPPPVVKLPRPSPESRMPRRIRPGAPAPPLDPRPAPSAKIPEPPVRPPPADPARHSKKLNPTLLGWPSRPPPSAKPPSGAPAKPPSGTPAAPSGAPAAKTPSSPSQPRPSGPTSEGPPRRDSHPGPPPKPPKRPRPASSPPSDPPFDAAMPIPAAPAVPRLSPIPSVSAAPSSAPPSSAPVPHSAPPSSPSAGRIWLPVGLILVAALVVGWILIQQGRPPVPVVTRLPTDPAAQPSAPVEPAVQPEPEAGAESESESERESESESESGSESETESESESESETESESESEAGAESESEVPSLAALPPVPVPFLPADRENGHDRARSERLRDEAATQTGEARMRYLAAAASADRGNPHAVADVAEYLSEAGQHPAAEAWAREAVRLRRRRASYHLLLGDVLAAAGKNAAARDAWQAALELDPRSAAAQRLQ